MMAATYFWTLKCFDSDIAFIQRIAGRYPFFFSHHWRQKVLTARVQMRLHSNYFLEDSRRNLHDSLQIFLTIFLRRNAFLKRHL
jgi:hypothetical protein